MSDSETQEQRLAGIRKRAREQMCEIYRNSGHNFSSADIEKLTTDAEFEVRNWAAFADSERERVLLEAAKAVCETCRMGLHELVQQHGLWFHPLNHSVHSVRCDAAAIHDLRSKGEGHGRKD